MARLRCSTTSGTLCCRARGSSWTHQPPKAAVYDLEQAIQDDVPKELLTAVLAGGLILDDLVTDHFVRDLHRRLYGDLWAWAGAFRQRELNIGVAPEHIGV